MKALALVLITVLALAITAWKKMKARQQLQLLESGGVCMHCRGTNVTRGERGIICGACGQTTSWALINQPALSQADIDKLNLAGVNDESPKMHPGAHALRAIDERAARSTAIAHVAPHRRRHRLALARNVGSLLASGGLCWCGHGVLRGLGCWKSTGGGASMV
jgi:hypothetical protein